MEFQNVQEITASSLGFNGKDPMAQRLADEVKDKIRDRQSCMAEAGALNLPPLLEARRLEHAIPDGAFAAADAFDAVTVWPISLYQDQKIGSLFVPGNVADKDKDTAPEGIIVSAGLKALQCLRTNGMDLGHHVVFLHMNPYWRECQRSTAGKMYWVRMLTVGDIRSSYDLAKDVKEGRVVLEELEDGTFVYARVGEPARRPKLPNLPEEY